MQIKSIAFAVAAGVLCATAALVWVDITETRRTGRLMSITLSRQEALHADAREALTTLINLNRERTLQWEQFRERTKVTGGVQPLMTLPLDSADPRIYRRQVDCPEPGPRTAIIFALGQSNAASYAGGVNRSEYGSRVSSFFDGACYLAQDPLAGGDGEGGSIWTGLANRLIEDGRYDSVLIVLNALGGSSIARWLPDADLGSRALSVMDGLRAIKLEPTHIVWIQGEADRAAGAPYNSEQAYSSALARIISSLRVKSDAPILISLASSCPSILESGGPSLGIRRAQAKSVEGRVGVYHGIDLDKIDDFSERFGCHLTETGLRRAISEMILAFNAIPSR